MLDGGELFRRANAPLEEDRVEAVVEVFRNAHTILLIKYEKITCYTDNKSIFFNEKGNSNKKFV